MKVLPKFFGVAAAGTVTGEEDPKGHPTLPGGDRVAVGVAVGLVGDAAVPAATLAAMPRVGTVSERAKRRGATASGCEAGGFFWRLCSGAGFHTIAAAEGRRLG